MKKILIFTSEFPPGPGGIGIHAYGLSRALQNEGFCVHVLADHRDMKNIKDSEWDKRQNINITRIKNLSPRFFTYFHRLLKLKMLLVKRKPDIIIASGMFPLMFTPSLAKSKKIKKIGVIHGTEANLKGLKKRWMRAQLERFDRLVCVSRFTAKIVHDNFQINNLSVIPNGFSPERFTLKAGCNDFHLEGNPALLTVGSISLRKGQHNVIRALPFILKKYPHAMYHIVGMIRDADALYRSIETLKMNNRVRLHGALSDEKLSCVYKYASVFMLLSEFAPDGDVEGFGIAALEANYFGKPVIGSKGTGVEEAVKPGFNGELVDPHNPEEIADALSKILSYYSNYSENAKRWALDHTWSEIVKRYIELFE